MHYTYIKEEVSSFASTSRSPRSSFAEITADTCKRRNIAAEPEKMYAKRHQLGKISKKHSDGALEW